MIVAMREPAVIADSAAGSRNAQVADAMHFFSVGFANVFPGLVANDGFAGSTCEQGTRQRLACAESRASHEARVD